MSDDKKDNLKVGAIIIAIMLAIQFGGKIFATKDEIASKDDVTDVGTKVDRLDMKVDDLMLELRVHVATSEKNNEGSN